MGEILLAAVLAASFAVIVAMEFTKRRVLARRAPVRTGPLPPVVGSPHREEGTLEYLHRWEDLLGGLCRAGFVIEDLAEPLHAVRDASRGSFAHRSQFVPPYVRIKARRTNNEIDRHAVPRLLLNV